MEYRKVIKFNWSDYQTVATPTGVVGLFMYPVMFFMLGFLYLFYMPFSIYDYYTNREIVYIKSPHKYASAISGSNAKEVVPSLDSRYAYKSEDNNQKTKDIKRSKT
jgi:hypothetical protein